MRVFVGIDINEEIKRKIIDLQKKISVISSKINFTRIENIHLTLKFLGEISEEKCKEFGQNLESILSDRKIFSLQIKNFDAFPCISNPRVLWVGIEKNDYLLEIQKDVEFIADRFGIPPEKNFKEHITIARNKNKVNIFALKQLQTKFRDFMFGNVTVDKVDIIESHLKPTGAEYRILKSIKLEDKKI